jgi:putative glycosyltransferase (TIGR04372 family)
MNSNFDSVVSYLRIFVQKQKGRTLIEIGLEVLLRALSLLLFPFFYFLLSIFSIVQPIKIGFLFHERIGHLALNTDLYLRRRFLGVISTTSEYHIFFVYSPANKQLVKMFSRQMILIDSSFLSKLLTPLGFFRTSFHIELPFFANEYNEFNSAPPQISFTSEEEERGGAFLKKIGLVQGEWYVCIFARDNNYYKQQHSHADLTFSAHRNADINTYEIAIRAILDAGGWVIRMGSSVEKKISYKHPRVIDYATNYREDFLDIYITSRARFFVGTPSGASDISTLFDIPYVGVNVVPIGYAPFGKHSIFIPKRVVYKSNGVEVPLQLQLEAFTENQVQATINMIEELDKQGWQFCDNKPEEIADAVIEMLDRLTGKFQLDLEYERALEWYSKTLPKTNNYRFNKSPICRKMLLTMHLPETIKKPQ